MATSTNKNLSRRNKSNKSLKKSQSLKLSANQKMNRKSKSSQRLFNQSSKKLKKASKLHKARENNRNNKPVKRITRFLIQTSQNILWQHSSCSNSNIKRKSNNCILTLVSLKFPSLWVKFGELSEKTRKHNTLKKLNNWSVFIKRSSRNSTRNTQKKSQRNSLRKKSNNPKKTTNKSLHQSLTKPSPTRSP